MFNRFNGLSVDEARSLYRKLARENHPDFGGDLRTMQAINGEYAWYSANFAKGEARQRADEAHNMGRKSAADYHDLDNLAEVLRVKVEALLNISPEIVVEVCGLWVWVTGDTRKWHEQIKAVEGMKYAHNKQAWYYAAVPSFNRKSHSMDEIRNMHGSQVFARKEEEQRMPLPA